MTATTLSDTPPKLGLALSGGGFRAAFFHVGVLASMAELGFLRKVEVISTVSGGSIVGALYYLRLKELLEKTSDRGMTDAIYRKLVADVEDQLRVAVRDNIRSRIFSNLWRNFDMAWPGYSRSNRIGELYESYLYKGHGTGGQDGSPVKLRDLVIEPIDEHGRRQTGFQPDKGNGDRRDKVPILLINATTLNTGHAWRFEAVRMGERLPEDPTMSGVATDVDKNMLLEQGYFGMPPSEPRQAYPGAPLKQARQFQKQELQDFQLGIAVAASAGVPGVFQPITIQDAYEGINVQLVDGGVHDNQGVQGVLDRGCTHVILSDGSGQMKDVEKPATRLPAVLLRSSSIASDSVRDEQLVRAKLQTKSDALMHLRTGLEGRVVAPGKGLDAGAPEREGGLSSSAFGVDPDVQDALSKIRTDLDFFSKVEASSLELDGYKMANHVLGGDAAEWRAVSGTVDDPPEVNPSAWIFKEEVGHLIGIHHDPYVDLLKVGAEKFRRPTRVAGPARTLYRVVLGLGLIALVLLVRVFCSEIKDALGSKIELGGALAALVVAAIVVALYLSRGGFSKGFFTLITPPLLLLAAFPLFLYALSQIALRPLLNKLDTIPDPPRSSD